jgi:hypothetical protein
MKQQVRDEFETMLKDVKMSDGKLNYKQSFCYENCKANVLITPEAYRKIVTLVTEFSSEVAWHGTVSRSDISINEFTIEDVFVYPQEVTGSTVNTDQEEYTKWLYALPDDTFNQIRMQGHSHVNMSVSPSGVDDRHRQQILEQLESDMFYIFMIWNKSLSIHTLIYDMANNILYEDKDVEVKLISDEGMNSFLNDAKEKVQKRSVLKPSKKSKKEERLEQIQRQEYFDEFGIYPHSRSDLFDPFFTGGERLRC